MTANQISAQRNAEDARHNREMESQGRAVISETSRHNYVQEGIQQGNLDELTRHNFVTETATFADLAEKARHNRRSEDETERHNYAQEGIQLMGVNETERHNRAQEDIGQKQLIISSKQAEALQQRADTEARAQRETARHNRAGENVATREVQVKEDKKDAEIWNTVSSTVKNYADSFGSAVKGVQQIFGLFATGGKSGAAASASERMVIDNGKTWIQ